MWFDNITHKMEPNLSDNPYVCIETRHLYLCDEIEVETGMGLLNGLYKLAQSDAPIRLIINSPGGSVSWGHALAQAITNVQQKGIEVRAAVYGEACSAAIFPLLACQMRTAPDGSVIMVHGLTTFNSGDVRNQEADAQVNKKLIEYQAEQLAARTRHNITYWRKLLRDNTPMYYTAREALEEGFIDALAD